VSTSSEFALHVEGFVPREKPRIFERAKIASLGITDNSISPAHYAYGLICKNGRLKRAKFCNQSTDF